MSHHGNLAGPQYTTREPVTDHLGTKDMLRKLRAYFTAKDGPRDTSGGRRKANREAMAKLRNQA